MFIKFINYLWELLSYNITPILVVWGWYQISRNWETLYPWVPRIKWNNGDNFTSEELLYSCVLPASTEVINTVINLIKAHVVLQDDIICEKKEWLWYVGVPRHIEHDFKKWEIHIIPFVWKNKDADTDYLNINADDITLFIWKLLWENVGKIFFLTWSGWIQDINGKNISFITKSNIERILKWEHKKIHI